MVLPMKHRRPIHWRFVRGIALLIFGVSFVAAVGYYALHYYMDMKIAALESDLRDRGVIRDFDANVTLLEETEFKANRNRIFADSDSAVWDSQERWAYADALMNLEGIEEIPGTRDRWAGVRDLTETDWATRGAAMLAESAQHYAEKGNHDEAWARIARALELCNVIGVEPLEVSAQMLWDASTPVMSTADELLRVALPPENLREEIDTSLRKLAGDQILSEMLLYARSTNWDRIQDALRRGPWDNLYLWPQIQAEALSFLHKAETAHALETMSGPERLAMSERYLPQPQDHRRWKFDRSDYWTSYIVETFSRHEARCDHLRLRLYIEQYREANGVYPESLDDLIPEYIEAVPFYAFSGKPFWYAKTEDGYSLRRERPAEAK